MNISYRIPANPRLTIADLFDEFDTTAKAIVRAELFQMRGLSDRINLIAAYFKSIEETPRVVNVLAELLLHRHCELLTLQSDAA